MCERDGGLTVPYYAIVVVIEAEDAAMANAAADPTHPEVCEIVFCGEPWEVRAVAPDVAERDEPEFDTLSCVDQHPER